jgi:hypothetical protein
MLLFLRRPPAGRNLMLVAGNGVWSSTAVLQRRIGRRDEPGRDDDVAREKRSGHGSLSGLPHCMSGIPDAQPQGSSLYEGLFAIDERQRMWIGTGDMYKAQTDTPSPNPSSLSRIWLDGRILHGRLSRQTGSNYLRRRARHQSRVSIVSCSSAHSFFLSPFASSSSPLRPIPIRIRSRSRWRGVGTR